MDLFRCPLSFDFFQGLPLRFWDPELNEQNPPRTQIKPKMAKTASCDIVLVMIGKTNPN